MGNHWFPFLPSTVLSVAVSKPLPPLSLAPMTETLADDAGDYDRGQSRQEEEKTSLPCTLIVGTPPSPCIATAQRRLPS